jgi:SagB-type dehydrogenase family enzyme
MMGSSKRAVISAALLIAVISTPAGAQALEAIALPAPRTEGGKPLMDALRERHSSREFSAKKLPLQTLSDLLWAAAGINRVDSGKRTAPSARNWQEIEVFVVLEEGAYVYDAATNTLKAMVAGDLRKQTGSQDFVGVAPLDLVYVADLAKLNDATPDDRILYSAADAAFLSENAYLFCASEGLATVVRGSVDRAALAAALKLPAEKRVILAQTVGYPGEPAKP